MEMENYDSVKNRIIESAELDQKKLLRPLVLFRGSTSEGRIRAMWNLITTMKDQGVPSVTEAVKLARQEDYRHLCGLHSNPVNTAFCGFLARLRSTPRSVADLIPGLREYADHLAFSPGATPYLLDAIPEYALKSVRLWRIMPGHLRPRKPRRDPLPEMYPYISGEPSTEHDLLLAVDAIVPKGLPNSTRSDVCQDMIVAVLSGEASVGNLRSDLSEFVA